VLAAVIAEMSAMLFRSCRGERDTVKTSVVSVGKKQVLIDTGARFAERRDGIPCGRSQQVRRKHSDPGGCGDRARD
jgi:hypothetical protein